MFETKFSQVSSQAPQLTSQNLPLLSCLSVPFIKVAATVITHQAVQCLLCHNNAGAFSFLQPASTGADLTRSQNQPVKFWKLVLSPCYIWTAKVFAPVKLREYPLSGSLLFQIELVCGDVSSTLQIKEDGVKQGLRQRKGSRMGLLQKSGKHEWVRKGNYSEQVNPIIIVV